MHPDQLTSITFFQKKKDITLYRASDASRDYILKSIITKDTAIKQAFYDEYYILSSLSHPSVPKYYALVEEMLLPGQEKPSLVLCMEDCQKPSPGRLLSLAELKEVMLSVFDVLRYLLEHGVLYTDLNPSNLIVFRQDEDWKIKLVDYTYCYYFLHNPRPAYSLRFSYNLSPALKGQQLLIQEMTLLFYELMEQERISNPPSSLFRLLETGRTPSPHLDLDTFFQMLSHCSC
ncbi:MAG: hypothetical protein Q4D60_04920 [Eubacteriales bacterium]|nr:hypothetical protein [Eubacteriales bacterium]